MIAQQVDLTTQGAYRFLVADDHMIVRRGLQNLIHDQFKASGFKEVASNKELLGTLDHWVPDLLILDLQMTDGSSLDYLERICKAHPEMRVLVYSMRSEAVYAQRVMALGSVGFLSKESSEEEVVRAIRRVLQGFEYMSPRTEMHFMEKDAEVIRDPFSQLSDREIAVMEDLLEGKGVKEISARLGVQPTTVATYKARLFDKLGVSNLIDLQAIVEAHRQSQA
ncbi:MAG TPA: response regulator transcription factor [Flavobacteriales bacterium]|nr:response regulator transcription factor [Flavobacteriales bacterium]